MFKDLRLYLEGLENWMFDSGFIFGVIIVCLILSAILHFWEKNK